MFLFIDVANGVEYQGMQVDYEKCEKLDECGFFQEYQGHTEVVKEAWIISYCNNFENSNLCKRKQYFITHGVAPVANMSPTGRLL